MNVDQVIKSQNAKGRLLLHVCCAPCFCGMIDTLTEHFEVTAFFYNPNLQPKEEFERRLYALRSLLSHYDGVRLVVPQQNENEYLTAVNGYENEQEGGARCERCIGLRLQKTAEYLSLNASEYDYFASTLSVSPHKNATLINTLGNKYAQRYGVTYLESDFKKKDGFLKSIRLSKQLGIYRQNYCGCSFSLPRE